MVCMNYVRTRCVRPNYDVGRFKNINYRLNSILNIKKKIIAIILVEYIKPYQTANWTEPVNNCIQYYFSNEITDSKST